MPTQPDTSKESGDTAGAEKPFAWLGRWLAGDEGVSTPDVTKAQATAVGQAAIAVLVVFGFNPSTDTRNIILGLATALAVALPVSDAAIRYGRAANAESIVKARRSLKGDASHASHSAGNAGTPSGSSSSEGKDVAEILDKLEIDLTRLAAELEVRQALLRELQDATRPKKDA
jgi:hypothetical protein